MVQADCLAPLLFVVGPTASGKSALGMELAARLKTEIISCDSMQIYRGMDIGTAKPTKAEQARITHRMIDICDIDQPYSAAKYVEDVECLLSAPGRGVPLFVGGTGLYVSSYLFSYRFAQAGKSDEIREELSRKLWEEGGEALYRQLAACDPEEAAAVHPNNVKRIMRALEIYRLTGRPKSERKQESVPRAKYFAVGLYRERSALYAAIDARVDRMIRDGLVEEVECILRRGYARNLQSMQAIGYREIAGYLAGECNLEEAVQAVKQNTRGYAKRQMTWFRKLPGVTWIDLGQVKNPVKDILEKYRCLF